MLSVCVDGSQSTLPKTLFGLWQTHSPSSFELTIYDDSFLLTFYTQFDFIKENLGHQLVHLYVQLD